MTEKKEHRKIVSFLRLGRVRNIGKRLQANINVTFEYSTIDREEI